MAAVVGPASRRRLPLIGRPVVRPGLFVPLATCFALAVRIGGLVLIPPLAHPFSYDEGAYYSAAALWARGSALYGDIVAVHPPAAFYFLAPWTFAGTPSHSFVVARIMMTLVGALNALLIGRIAQRFVPSWAAAVGVVVYAVIPAAVVDDRSILLEPLLNLACLAAAAAWLRRDGDERKDHRRAWLTGALIGVAIATKLWGVLLLAPVLATADRERVRSQLSRVAGGAVVAFAALVLPTALRAPGAFFDQVVRFQVSRRSTGEPTFGDRVFRVVADPRHLALGSLVLVTAVLLVVGAALASGVRPPRFARFALVWVAVLAVVFIASPVYDDQYVGHLAPSVGLLAAWGSAAWWPRRRDVGSARRIGAWVAVGVLAAGVVQSIRVDRALALDRTQDVRDLQTIVPALPECVFSFEPGWLVMGDRFPDPELVGRGATDSFAASLMDEHRDGHRASGSESPRYFRREVERCDVVILGARGRWELGDDLEWFRSRFRQIDEARPNGPDVWRRIGTG